MKWQKSSDTEEESARAFRFCVPEDTLYLWMMEFTDYRVTGISNNYTYMRFVDDSTRRTIYSPLTPASWTTLNDKGDIPAVEYQPFVSLVTHLYTRYVEADAMNTERVMYDPNKYILQCDFEDDCFMVFAESSAEKEWGNREFSIALTENHFKRLLTTFSNYTVHGIDFQIEDARYGCGKLILRTNNGPMCFPCEKYSDISGSIKIRSYERIHLIHTLLQTLYDKEFSKAKNENEETIPCSDENVSKSDVDTTKLNRLIRLQEELDWFLADVLCPKYHNNKERFCEECEIMKEIDNEIRIERKNCDTK